MADPAAVIPTFQEVLDQEINIDSPLIAVFDALEVSTLAPAWDSFLVDTWPTIQSFLSEDYVTDLTVYGAAGFNLLFVYFSDNQLNSVAVILKLIKDTVPDETLPDGSTTYEWFDTAIEALRSTKDGS